MDEIEIARITITMTLTDEDQLVHVDSSENLPTVTALGMLRLAEGSILNGDDDE